MGLSHMRLRVGNVANPEMTEELDFLVDSGAIYSVVPGDVLGRLGVQPLGEQEFRLANGTRIVRKKGVALFRYGDRVGGADVIFGEPEDALLLGAFTLELARAVPGSSAARAAPGADDPRSLGSRGAGRPQRVARVRRSSPTLSGSA